MHEAGGEALGIVWVLYASCRRVGQTQWAQGGVHQGDAEGVAYIWRQAQDGVGDRDGTSRMRGGYTRECDIFDMSMV